jgi:hypothetical protein
MTEKGMNTMSNYSFRARASCLFLAAAIFLVLGRYTVNAEATHSGEFNFSGPGSTIFIYQNQTRDTQLMFVTVCVSAGGAVSVVGPFSTFAVGSGGCRGSSVELDALASIGITIPTPVAPRGTYQLSTSLHTLKPMP